MLLDLPRGYPEVLGRARRRSRNVSPCAGWTKRVAPPPPELTSAAERVEQARALKPSMPEIDAVQRNLDDARGGLELGRERDSRGRGDRASPSALARVRPIPRSVRPTRRSHAIRENADAQRIKQQASADSPTARTRGCGGGPSSQRGRAQLRRGPARKRRPADVEPAVALAQQLFAGGALDPGLKTIAEGLAIDPPNQPE